MPAMPMLEACAPTVVLVLALLWSLSADGTD